MRRRTLPTTSRHDHAHRDSTHGRDDETEPDLPHGDRAAGRRDRHAQRDDRGGVVDQALALQDRHDAPRQPDPAGDRRGRDGVRRRDDRAERECRRPLDRQDRMHEHRDPGGGEQHQPDAEQGDRPPVRPEVDQRRPDGRGVEQRRQQADQHDLRRQLEVRHERQVRAGDADHDEPERSRDREAFGDRADRDGDRDEGHQRQRDIHGANSTIWRHAVMSRTPARPLAGARVTLRALRRGGDGVLVG